MLYVVLFPDGQLDLEVTQRKTLTSEVKVRSGHGTQDRSF
jgi:hypothetical protein